MAKIYYCINKVRDNNGKIIGYNIINNYCEIVNIEAEKLKKAIRKQTMIVKNLKLTIDNRIIDGENSSNIDGYIQYKCKAMLLGIQDYYTLDILENKVWLVKVDERASRTYTIEKFVTNIGIEDRSSKRIIGPFSWLNGHIKVINKSEQLVNMRGLFGFSKLESIDLSEFNWSKAKSLREFFYSCEFLKNIIMPTYSTPEVTDMASMFYGCRSLEYVDLTRLNTEKVTTMEYMFEFCANLKEVCLENFNTSNLLSIDNMFDNCTKLKRLDLSSFVCTKLRWFRNVFIYCSELEYINLQNIKLEADNIYPRDDLFIGCNNLKQIRCSDYIIIRSILSGNRSDIKIIRDMR